MGHTLFRVLELFLLNTLLYVHTEVSNKASLTLQPNWPQIFKGETITLRCQIQGGGGTDWTYEWIPDRLINTSSTNNEYRISSATESDSGEYRCKGAPPTEAISAQAVFREKKENMVIPVPESREEYHILHSLSKKERPVLRMRMTTLLKSRCILLGKEEEETVARSIRWFLTSTGEKKRIPNNAPYVPSDAETEKMPTRKDNLVWLTSSFGGKKTFLSSRRSHRTAACASSPRVRCSRNIREGSTDQLYVEEMKKKKKSFSLPCLCCVIMKTKSNISSEAEEQSDVSVLDVKMGHTLLRVLELFLLNTLLYVHAEVENPKPRLTVDTNIIHRKNNVTLTCSVEGSAVWKYDWFKRTSDSSEAQSIRNGVPENITHVSEEGLYHCRGRRGDPPFYTEYSNEVAIQKYVSNKASLTLQPNWPQIFSGETITLRCQIEGGGDTDWTYQWIPDRLNTPPTNSEYRISSATESDSGEYRCIGRRDSYSFTDWSDPITLTVSSNRPKAELSADDRDIPVGGSVTLTCSVKTSSSGWKYFWYRGEKTSEPLNTQDVLLSTGQISVSQEGVYWCRGGRGEPVYYTEYSDSISINKSDTNKAVVTLQPNWSEIFSGETITLRCEIKNGGDTEWEYEWKTTSSEKPSNQKEVSIRSASGSHSGDYRCKGRNKNKQSTDWSDPIKLTVSDEPLPVLTVSPLWLNAGDSVTLNCEVKHPSAGWRFYWYKAVPKLPNNFYSVELLPGSSNGTEQDSYIVDGQTGTARYVCRAGRGDPVYYTQYSKPKLVWSGAVSRPESSSFSVGLIVGLVCGIVLLLLLFLLYRYRSSNNSCFIRQSQSERTNQGSDTNQVVNQNEAQGEVYSNLLNGDDCVYETIKGPEDTENDEYQNVASSSIELKKVG
ncbi:uncharacterized protein LOC109139830 [Larimichthys crocea]|uniref:uncharacterized protein LOC109139830 n=1 Tax=Larimichthys crocea TaxID=215358 RepID=UPI000F5FF468|nr:uncharacterized protein LOC109139830 [Larimichthys crocea]